MKADCQRCADGDHCPTNVAPRCVDVKPGLAPIGDYGSGGDHFSCGSVVGSIPEARLRGDRLWLL
jgi:hypothetical protein